MSSATAFQDKVVIVTGGAAGIGKNTSLALAAAGAKVVISERNKQQGDAVVAEIEREGGTALFFHGDMAVEAEIEALIRFTVCHFGRLDMAFNNAAVASAGPFLEVTAQEYNIIFSLNVWGVMALMKHEIRAILETKGSGSIVNNTSIAAFRGVAGMSVYASSKAAVENLSKSVAVEFASRGIRVNTIAPGPIDTDILNRTVEPNAETRAALTQLVPVGYIGAVDDITRGVLFLLDPANVYVTGASLSIDGGAVAKLM